MATTTTGGSGGNYSHPTHPTHTTHTTHTTPTRTWRSYPPNPQEAVGGKRHSLLASGAFAGSRCSRQQKGYLWNLGNGCSNRRCVQESRGCTVPSLASVGAPVDTGEASRCEASVWCVVKMFSETASKHFVFLSQRNSFFLEQKKKRHGNNRERKKKKTQMFIKILCRRIWNNIGKMMERCGLKNN